MNHAQIKAILEGVIPAVQDAIGAATRPLMERIAVLENTQPLPGLQGERGEKGDPGASVTIEDVAPLVASEMAKAVAALPVPEKGDPGVPGERGEKGDPGAPGERGPAGDIAVAPPDIADCVASGIRMLAESPVPAVAAAVSPPINLSLDLSGTYTKRSFRFERGPDNHVLAAHEEAQA